MFAIIWAVFTIYAVYKYCDIISKYFKAPYDEEGKQIVKEILRFSIIPFIIGFVSLGILVLDLNGFYVKYINFGPVGLTVLTFIAIFGVAIFILLSAAVPTPEKIRSSRANKATLDNFLEQYKNTNMLKWETLDFYCNYFVIDDKNREFVYCRQKNADVSPLITHIKYEDVTDYSVKEKFRKKQPLREEINLQYFYDRAGEITLPRASKLRATYFLVTIHTSGKPSEVDVRVLDQETLLYTNMCGERLYILQRICKEVDRVKQEEAQRKEMLSQLLRGLQIAAQKRQ